MSDALLSVEVFKGKMAKEDDKLTAKVFHFYALLEVALGGF